MRAGGDNKMAEPQKRKLTLDELRAKTAKAIKEATTFEKSPTYDIALGSEILFKVKLSFEGNYGFPLVVCSELRVMGSDGKFIAGPLKAYTQDGLTGPRVWTEVKPGEDILLPAAVSRAATKKGLAFHPMQVYWAKYLEDKKVEKGTFKLVAVDLVGTDFPE